MKNIERGSSPLTRLCMLSTASLMAVGLAGCAHTLPRTDAQFGQAVRASLAAQAANGRAGLKTVGPGQDGQAAVMIIERYRGTYKEPPSSFAVGGIGSGSGR
jgi:type IV pilus biogenesis protein CpaD/CtpE